MNYHSLSDLTIAKELGHRLKQLRLNQNYSQQELAKITTLSLNTIKALELGNGKLCNFISVLRHLNRLDQLDSFIPNLSISPLQLAKMQGKQRQRASKQQNKENYDKKN